MTTESTVQNTLPEAPVSATVKVAWRGYDVLYTTRGHTGGEVLVALDKALTWFEEHGGKPAPTNGYTNGNGHAAPVAAPTQPAQPSGGEIGYHDCEWYEIGANKGQPVCGFWRSNRDYAEISLIGHERIAQFMDPLNLPTALAIEKYMTPLRVHYKLGKERPAKDGKPPSRYQDVTRVEFLAPA